MYLSLFPRLQVHDGDDALYQMREFCPLELFRAVIPSYINVRLGEFEVGGFVLWLPRVS